MSQGTSPKRIQRQRRKGWKMPANTISVTRPGKWGNPFAVVAEDGGFWVKDAEGNYWGSFYPTREEAIGKAVRLFAPWIEGKIDGGELDLTALRGKDLACWCPVGGKCHADILLELANA